MCIRKIIKYNLGFTISCNSQTTFTASLVPASLDHMWSFQYCKMENVCNVLAVPGSSHLIQSTVAVRCFVKPKTSPSSAVNYTGFRKER